MPSSGLPARARAVLGAAVLALGGAGCGGEGMGDTGVAGSSDTGAEPPPRPTFSEPASGRLLLQTTRVEDVTLAVEQVSVGRTQLILNGRSVGPLDEQADIGRLEATSLRLFSRGSLLPGQHSLLMRTIESTGLVESEEIIVEIFAELGPGPTAQTPAPTGVPAERLHASGRGEDALLVTLESTEEGPRLHLVPRRADASGWDPAGVRTVAVPGLALDPSERVLPVSALRYDREDGAAGRLRVAWRVGVSGSQIDLLDVPWDDADPSLPPQASMTLAEALDDRPTEWGAFGRPWLLSDLLLVELSAPLDVESPRPGDRGLVWSRVQSDAAGLDPPQRVSVRADLVDLDQLGPVLDPIAREQGGPPAVTIRADQHQPLILEVDAAGGLRARPTTVDGSNRSFSFVDMPLHTITGAFGARTVAGFTARSGGRMRVAMIDDLGNGGVDEHSLAGDDLADLGEVTGDLAAGSLRGVSVFAVPYGSFAPVHVLYTTGSVVRVEVLSGVNCHGVALSDSPDADGSLPMACATEGELRLGALTLAPEE